ncbi:polymorphic toxin type 23 domain-containing protein [Flavobacterium sp. CFS9]
MKKFYFALAFSFMGLFIFGQTGSTGYSTEVGITEGELSVSLSGAANYTVPIAVPPGINGVVPQISLTYNSQGGNGAAGYGWNISGVSIISRIPSTKFHDNIIDPVDFDSYDRFAYNGQRLILKSGTYGGDGAIYETENFSNVKITSYGVHPNGANYGPAYFRVEHPDGSKAFYGNSSDSRSITDWAITYWENEQNVRISYSYLLENNVLEIASIKYGTLSTTTPINAINFNYDLKTRPEQVYIAGQNLRRTKKISSINVIGNGIGFRNYSLDYFSTSLDYDQLKRITEKSGDNSKSLNPTVFEYGEIGTTIDAKPTVSPLVLGEINSNNSATVSGDFDGDAKMDFVLYSTTVGVNMQKEFWMFTGIDNNSSISTIKVDSGYFGTIFPSNGLTSDNKKYHYQGVTISQGDEANHNAINFKTYYKYSNKVLPDYTKQAVFPERWIQNCTESSSQGGAKFFFSGDFNGDGLTDVMALDQDIQELFCEPDPYGGPDQFIYSTNSPSQFYFVDLDRRKTSNFVNYAGTLQEYFLSTDSRIETFDVNGDGKTDILHFKNGKVYVYTLNNDNQLEFLWKTLDQDIKISQAILSGDYNGDGKMDFIIAKSTGLNANEYVKFLSTGIGFVKTTETYAFVNRGSSSDRDGVTTRNFIPLDINADGKTDIVQFTTAFGRVFDGGRVYIDVFKNANDSFLPSVTYDTTPLKAIRSYPLPVFLSPKTNNQYLSVGVISNSQLYSFDSKNDFSKEVLLNSITTGNGVKETVTYNSLQQDQYEPLYVPTIFTETFPNVDIIVAPSFRVVSMLEKQSKDVYKKQRYFYSGAVSNVEGLGFLGFRSTVKTNWYDKEESIISSLSKNDISLRGANVENYTVLGLHSPLLPNPNAVSISSTIVKDKNYTVVKTDNLVATQSIVLKPDTWIKPETGHTFSAKINEDGNAGTSINTPVSFITKSLLAYESELLANKVFKIKNIKTKQFNVLEDTGSETFVEYDTNNNPLKSTALLKESGSTVQTTISSVTYVPSTVSPYVVGRPSGKNESIAVSGDTMTSEELYYYQNGLLTQIKKKGTNTDYIVEDNQHDTFGNIIQKTITASGLPARVTSYGYDPSGRFLTRSTDIEKLSTTFVYNTDGTLESETNPYGLKTSYLYDSWSKKTTTTDYLGKKTSYLYSRSGSKTIVTSTADDGSVSEQTFDDLGRKVRSGSKNVMGTLAYVDYLYDIHDRNYKVSEPYFGLTGTQWNETKYDIYGRVFQSIAFTGKTTDIVYSGRTSTVSDGTKSKATTKNAMGNVVSMTDTPGGTVKYTYFANGNLKESDYDGVKTTIKQDGWGRKTELKDPSAGTFTYAYNAFGETVSETTPNGTTAYVINDFGKVTQKTVDGTNTKSITTYDYDSSSKLLLGSEFKDFKNGSTSISKTIVYDDSKRIHQTVEKTPYAEFTKEFGYDEFGRVSTEISIARAGGKSSSKTIKNTYKNGSHWQILDNDTSAVLWQTNTVNERGQLVNAQNGPTTINNIYDTYGFASQFKYDKTSGSSNILTLNTLFDAKRGNLISRSNSQFGRNESFKYDAQDRLTEYTNGQGVQEKQLYDDQGRITENNLGTYSYSKDKPYQNNAIAVTPEALTYYTAKPRQIISYNVFNSPVQIEEKDIDKVSFTYNDNDSRTAMFYGGLQDEKLDRPLQKYYSEDGSMEIKFNKTTSAYEFITYIGGDGYSAPIVLKSNGTAQDYLYLQRDYQGSIVGIVNQTGNVVEKRLFDAWGAIVSVQDGSGNVLTGLTVLDRGYTGHEHLQSVGLINMNGRIYDPKLHRFLQPDNFVQDPFNTQNYNRYGYCWNNPLKYTDPSGEFIWVPIVIGAMVGAISGGVAYTAKAIQTGNWNIGQFGMAVLGGAVIGGITGGIAPMSVVGVSMGNVVASAFIGGMMPSYGVQVGDWSFSISPSIAFGNTMGIGASLSVTYSSGNFSFSAGVGIMSNSNYNGLGKNGMEIRKSILASYDDGKNGVSLGSNIWGGDFAQRTGVVGLHFGDFRAMYENDGGPVLKKGFGDAGDSYRTAALNLSVGKFTAGFNLFTGKRENIPEGKSPENRSIDGYGRKYTYGNVDERGTKYRLGALTVGYGSYRVGVNSEHVRHAIQDRVIHGMIHDQGFQNQSWDWKGYSQYRTSNGFTSW